MNLYHSLTWLVLGSSFVRSYEFNLLNFSQIISLLNVSNHLIFSLIPEDPLHPLHNSGVRTFPLSSLDEDFPLSQSTSPETGK